MYIEIRKIKRARKYYLAHSFREGGKVKKMRVYLGRDLSKRVLKERVKKAEELIKQQLHSYRIIRSPIKYEISKREIILLKSLEKKSKFKIFHLSKKDWELFTELFTYNTNAIEGSTVTYPEVLDILKRNKWPYNKDKEEISEAYGVSEAIKYIRKLKVHISLALIKKLHKIVFKNSKTFAGKLRGRGVEVAIKDGIGNIIHLGAPSSRVVSLLTELVKWYNKNRKKYPPIVLAAVIHNQFEVIHPFEDGNGRVGRLLMNNILIKNKMPPVSISMSNRKRYYKTLKEYQSSGNIRPIIELILKEYRILKRKLKRK
ncbi:Fic family protein [Candidatus Pacearchaeota archaeon]|nr:Fic family protein [Candidatus Pacearchaeota archaeon]